MSLEVTIEVRAKRIQDLIHFTGLDCAHINPDLSWKRLSIAQKSLGNKLTIGSSHVLEMYADARTDYTRSSGVFPNQAVFYVIVL